MKRKENTAARRVMTQALKKTSSSSDIKMFRLLFPMADIILTRLAHLLSDKLPSNHATATSMLEESFIAGRASYRENIKEWRCGEIALTEVLRLYTESLVDVAVQLFEWEVVLNNGDVWCCQKHGGLLPIIDDIASIKQPKKPVAITRMQAIEFISHYIMQEREWGMINREQSRQIFSSERVSS